MNPAKAIKYDSQAGQPQHSDCDCAQQIRAGVTPSQPVAKTLFGSTWNSRQKFISVLTTSTQYPSPAYEWPSLPAYLPTCLGGVARAHAGDSWTQHWLLLLVYKMERQASSLVPPLCLGLAAPIHRPPVAPHPQFTSSSAQLSQHARLHLQGYIRLPCGVCRAGAVCRMTDTNSLPFPGVVDFYIIPSGGFL